MQHRRSKMNLKARMLREIFDLYELNEQNYSRKCRLALAMKYSKLCKNLANQGFNVVIATISLFKEIHLWNRSSIPGYYEVYMKVPISVLRRRDFKKIYQRYDTGKLKNVAGPLIKTCIENRNFDIKIS